MRRRNGRRKRLQITLTFVAAFIPVLLLIAMMAGFWYLGQQDQLDSNTDITYFLEE